MKNGNEPNAIVEDGEEAEDDRNLVMHPAVMADGVGERNRNGKEYAFETAHSVEYGLIYVLSVYRTRRRH